MKVSCSLLRSGEIRSQYFFGGWFFILLLLSGKIFGQQVYSENNLPSSSAVNVNFAETPFTPYFVENKGQFDQYDANNSKKNFIRPSYGSEMGNAILLFNGNSVQFVENIIKNNEKESEEGEKRKDLSKERELITWRQAMNFVGADPAATFETEESQQQYFTYPDPNIPNGTITANAWAKLICKNIYPGIDVEFSYKKEGGIKYSFIVHPGADASVIKIEWSGVENSVVDENGNLQVKSENGIYTDKAPASFYLEDASATVASSFSVKGKTISFSLGNYDHAKTLVIDPWVFSPALMGNNRAYDIQHDPSGNIYVYGGSNPYQLKKFTSAGAPIWTFNTSASGYYGDFTIDAVGNAFCIYGPWGDRCIKLTPAGTLVWNVAQNGSREIYRVYPNPVNVGQLTIMGMGMPAGPLKPMVLNINMNTGAYTGPFLHPVCNAGETRGMAVDVNGDAYGLVWSTVSANAANNLLWKVNAANATLVTVQSGYLLGESSPSNTDSWFSGYNGVAVGCYVYTYNGQVVKKWDKTTLALLGSATVPGGMMYQTGGICTDACGNVYVGGPNSILEFDANLVLLTSVATTGQVFDVNLGNVPGEILGCGNGFFGSYTFPVCTTPTISSTSTPATCSGCNGSATVTLTPVGSYTYSWSPSGGNGPTATNLCPGTYTVTAIGGCTTYTATIVIPNAGGGLTLANTQTDVSCNSLCDGSTTTTITGGTGPYTFTWSPAVSNSTSVNVNSSTGLCAGTYTLNVLDAGGCTGAATITITEPSTLSSTYTQLNPLCNGGRGSATLLPSGGTGPYTYSWSPSGGSGATSSPIGAGTYTATVTDAHGCTSINIITITEPSLLTASITSSPVVCNGGNTGSATVTAAGGASGYTYAWSPSGGTGTTESNLAMGTYTCTVTDLNGCTAIDSITVTEPTALTTTASQIDELCHGGNNASATVAPTGGTGAYTYAWTPSGGSGATESTLLAGTYTCTITDANGCFITQSFTITEPNVIVLTPTEVDAHCNQADGSASVTAVGGSGAYTYNWMPGNIATQNLSNVIAGVYTITVTDANGCTGIDSITINNLNGVVASIATSTNIACFGQSTGAITVTQTGGNPTYTYAWLPNISVGSSANGIPAGTYQITVSDANGCTSTVSITLTQPPQLTINATSTPTAVCSGLPVTLNSTPAGGTPAWNVVWTPGNLSGNSQNITATSSTTYTATVTDANGCIDSTTTTVVVNPIPSAALVGDVLSGCVPLCVNFSDASTISALGVITSWSWDFGDGSPASPAQNPTHCYSTPGTYTIILKVVSADGCMSTITMTNYITVFPNPIAAFGASPQPATVLDPFITFSDSSINASSWLWSFGDILNSTSILQNPTFSYTDADCYEVVLAVASSNGCVDTATKQVCIGPDVAIYVPNAFTPNGDGHNDMFVPVGLGIDPDHYELWIFDRWGNLIFHTTDLSKGWDGRANGGSNIAQVDTYVWKIEAKDVVGNGHELIGRVSLIK